jgi:Lrp/AsnC family transcriptional regulator for asnA, asnC and gidA
MDKLDFDIISFLQSDGRKPFTDNVKLDVSEGTVRNRISRLIEDRVLHIVGLIDPASLGFNAPAMIGLSIHTPLLESVAEPVATFDEVSCLILVSGVFDLFGEVLCRDRDHLA